MRICEPEKGHRGSRGSSVGKPTVEGQRFYELVDHYRTEGITLFPEELRNTLWNEAGWKREKELVIVPPVALVLVV